MANFAHAFTSFTLKSTYTGDYYSYTDDHGVIVNTYKYTNATTASKTVTVDTSAIPKNARIISATLSGSTNGNGDSHADANGSRKNITNAFSADVAAWFSAVSDSLEIKFTFKAYANSGGKGNHVKVCDFKNMALAVEYTTDEEAGESGTATIDISGGECFLCRRHGQ